LDKLLDSKLVFIARDYGGRSHMVNLEQTQSFEIMKADLGLSGETTISCPFCGKHHCMAIPKYLRNRPVRLKCECGKSFPVLFDSRKHRRSEVWLPGEYWNPSGEKELMAVTSLSAAGVGFKVSQSKPLISIGETIQISFILNDGYGTYICTQVIVRGLDRNRISGEFLRLDEHQRKFIGFYLKGGGN
jgi:hypothetical protein